MKVYVITKGCYSDYCIEAVTLDEHKAHILAKKFSDSWEQANVEEYDTEEFEPIEALSWEVSVYGKRSPKEGCYISQIKNRFVSNNWEVNYFKRIDKYRVYVRAKDEEHAKKIAFDRIAQYKAEHEKI